MIGEEDVKGIAAAPETYDQPLARVALPSAHYGLDKPLYAQFGIFLQKAVQGDFGKSFVYKTRTVTEIMVNGPRQVYIERSGKLELTNVVFQNDDHVMRIIDRIIAPIGRRVDESSPMVDARLTDGSRVNAIIPPLSLSGPLLTIRRFANERFDLEELAALNARILHQLAHLAQLALVLQRPQAVRLIQTVPHRDAARVRDQRVTQRLVERVMHVEALERGAGPRRRAACCGG